MTFAEKVYEVNRQITKGKVSNYKIVAENLGSKAYRAVGQALRKNPYAPEVPCHRVVASDGSIGGFMGDRTGDSIKKKIDLLQNEGVKINQGKVARECIAKL